MNSTGRINCELRRLLSHSYDRCRHCDVGLTKGSPAYAGYAADEAPLYVGECCKGAITELATLIYWWMESDKRCEPDTALWRYMDLAKFLVMLESRAIYFARADTFDDRFEGAAGLMERQEVWDDHHLAYFRDAIAQAPWNKDAEPCLHDIDKQARSLLHQTSVVGGAMRRYNFVSCWHANAGESEAQWRLYCPNTQSGVAIKTTADSLMRSLEDCSQVKLGRVLYIDYRTGFAGTNDRIFWKRKSLAHEAEVRAVIHTRHPTDGRGIPIRANLETLLHSVVASPFAASWFPPLLEATMRRFGLNMQVTPSELLASPFF
jgi:hypothetical protein